MGSLALIDPQIYIGGYDMTGDSNELALRLSVKELENTPFGFGGYRRRIGGFKNVEMALAGFYSPQDQDLEVFTNLAAIDKVATVTNASTEGSVAYFWQTGSFKYKTFGPAGEVMPFRLDHKGTNGVGAIRGQLAKTKGTVSATGQLGSILTLTNVAATEFVYATLHVPVAGTTITVQVQSAPTIGFAAPTTRGTIGPVTLTGGYWMTRVAGPITDQFWRMNVSAITGTFTVAGAIGIRS